MSEELGQFESETAPPPIGITDDAHGVGYQDQALGVTQDLAGEIPLALQFGLGMAKTADVQEQPAVLLNRPLGIAHGEAIDQHVYGRSILAAQNLFVVAQPSLALDNRSQFLPPLGLEVNLIGNIHLQQ